MTTKRLLGKISNKCQQAQPFLSNYEVKDPMRDIIMAGADGWSEVIECEPRASDC